MPLYLLKRSHASPVSDTDFNASNRKNRFSGLTAFPQGMEPLRSRPFESEDDMNHECMETKNLMALYQAGLLTDEQKIHLNQHLLFCSDCVYQMVLLQAS